MMEDLQKKSVTLQCYQLDRDLDHVSACTRNCRQSVVFIEISNLGIHNCHRTLPPRTSRWLSQMVKSGDRLLKTYIKNVSESFWGLGNKTLD